MNFDKKHSIAKLKNLERLGDLTYFKCDLKSKPSRDELEKTCIEISKRTPDSKQSVNEDEKNENMVNPYVGAILVQKDKSGYHVYGSCRSALHDGRHGECTLLKDILGDCVTDGCEMYVSLEPCTQESRHEWTEPCCEIIKARRIKKVVVGMLDPNPDVAGYGIRYLSNNGIEVEFFDLIRQKEIKKINKDFIEQFSNDSDPRVNRKIARIIDSYISDTAVNYFLEITHKELEIPCDEKRKKDNKYHFYQKMIENRSIIDGKSKLLPFDVIKDFALFFYKFPYHTVDGATIRYIIENGNDKNENDPLEINYDGPLALAYDNNNPNEYKLSFIEVIGKIYYKTSKLEELKKFGKQFIYDKLGSDGEKWVREAFINAVMHRDYEENLSFTRITLSDLYIKIENPVSKKLGEIETLKKAFENKIMPSRPVNPKLMRYFQLINMCERNGSGMGTLKQAASSIELAINDNYILTTTINFREKKKSSKMSSKKT